MRILVAYASRYGGTKAIAERIAQTFQEDGLQPEVRLIKEVEALDGFDAYA